MAAKIPSEVAQVKNTYSFCLPFDIDLRLISWSLAWLHGYFLRKLFAGNFFNLAGNFMHFMSNQTLKMYIL